jgi:DNA-binding NarL/FixJ family response regulator
MVKEPSEVQWIEVERQVVALVVQGQPNSAIAEKLFLSEPTVETVVHDILRNVGLSDRLDLILYGILHGMGAKAASLCGKVSPRGLSVSAQTQSA